MPHDRNGKLLEPGARVIIPATVVVVHQTEGDAYCNLDVDLLPMPPSTEPYRMTSLNTRQVEKAECDGAVPLGAKVTDPVTGITGTAVARAEYLHGSPRVCVEWAQDSKVNQWWFEEGRLTVPVAE